MSSLLRYHGLTDRGLVRSRNEDNWCADPDTGLFIVSDGMGGQPAGKLASDIVVRTLPMLIDRQASDSLQMTASLQSAMVSLSEHLRDESRGQMGLEGMGATVATVWIRSLQAVVGHMGDSRVYLLRKHRMRQLTGDHTLVRTLVDAGAIDAKQAATHPSRGQLTRYVGMSEEAVPEVQTVSLCSGDRLLLCTDGLTGMLADETIRSILNRGFTEPATCRQLIAAASTAGGRDNVTVVIVAVSGA